MEFTKVNFLLLAGALSLGLVSSCDTNKLAECATKVQSVASMAGQAGSNKEALANMCKVLTEVSQCFEKATQGCSPEISQQMSQGLAALGAASSMCDPSNSCSLMKIQECIPESLMGMQDDNINYKEACMAFPKMKTCMTKVQASCTDPNMQKKIADGMSQFTEVEKQCKKRYGDNYAVEAGKQDGGNNNNNNNNKDNAAGKVAGMAGFLLVTFMFAKLAL